MDGEREFAGLLIGLSDGEVTIELENGERRSFPQKEIALVHVIDDAEDFDEDAAEETEF